MGLNLYMLKLLSLCRVPRAIGSQWGTICTYFICSTSIPSNQQEVREAGTDWKQFIIRLYLAMWTKAAGVDFGSWPSLASSACRAPAVGAAERPGSPQNSPWNTCTATFSWQPASRALQSYLIRPSKASPQCSLLAALTVAFITGSSIWVESRAYAGLGSTQCIHKQAAPQGPGPAQKGETAAKASPWWAKGILVHHTPG